MEDSALRVAIVPPSPPGSLGWTARSSHDALVMMHALVTMKPSRHAPALIVAALSLATGCINTDGLFFPDDTSSTGGTGGGASTGGGTSTGGTSGAGGSGGASTDYRSEVLADEPIAYWPLDVFDASLRTESLVGDVTANVMGTPGQYDTALAGRLGQGARLDQRADVSVPAPHMLGFGNGSYTLEAWVRVSGAAGSQVILSCWAEGSPVGVGYATYVGPTSVNHKRYDGATSESASTDAPDLTDWTHVVVTHDDAMNLTQVFVSGQLFVSSPQVFSWQHQARFMLARAGFNAGETVDIDEVAVYDKVLPAARIARHHACVDGCPDL